VFLWPDYFERKTIMTHQSRWGWHPCDYTTFLILKRFNMRCEAARRQYAAWKRWNRKMPANRVQWKKILDEQGRLVEWRIVAMKPEPVLDPLFCKREQVRVFWDRQGKHLKDGEVVERVSFDDLGIPEAYRSARHPVETAQFVQPLKWTSSKLLCLEAITEALCK
jgi:hypothetical protein